jgi:sugar lactone lactonase YvrE
MKNQTCILALSVILYLHVPFVCAQELPPIFENTPSHPVASNTIASFPEKTFLENLLVLPDNDILVTSHYEGIIYKVSEGETKTFASVEGKVTGIAAYGKDRFILSGNDQQDKAVLYVLDSKGNIRTLVSIPEARFVNGVTLLKGNDFLVADSYKGCIWKVNVETRQVSQWLTDDLLKRSSDQNPTPGANGIKIANNTLYISNTQQQMLLTVKLKGTTPEKPAVFVRKVNIDDFTIDEGGTIYASTHVYNSVIKITPDKQITTIAGQAEGVAGSTACVLYKEPVTGKRMLYVSTNGGMYYPPATGIEESKIIALRIQ